MTPLFEVWGVFLVKYSFHSWNVFHFWYGSKPKVFTICYFLFLINANPVINCCWTFGSATEDPVLVSLIFLLLRAEEVKVFLTKIRHLTPRTFPDILNTVGSVTLWTLSPKLLALLWANFLLHVCGNRPEKQRDLPLVLCLPEASFSFRPEGNHHPVLLSIKRLQENKGDCGQLPLVWSVSGSHFVYNLVAFMLLWVSQLRI